MIQFSDRPSSKNSSVFSGTTKMEGIVAVQGTASKPLSPEAIIAFRNSRRATVLAVIGQPVLFYSFLRSTRIVRTSHAGSIVVIVAHAEHECLRCLNRRNRPVPKPLEEQ